MDMEYDMQMSIIHLHNEPDYVEAQFILDRWVGQRTKELIEEKKLFQDCPGEVVAALKIIALRVVNEGRGVLKRLTNL